MDNRPIGVFDSGVGGFTVAKELLKVLPYEEIIYFGDTKRAPYGEKTIDDLKLFSSQIMNFLLSKNCKAVVVACNTVSSTCLDYLKNTYKNIPIVDVVTASIQEATEKTQKNLGILATKATIRSNIHKNQLSKIRPDINVYGKECPLFVPIVEEDFINTEIPFIAAKEYYKSFKDKNIDTLILGCTHYPLIRDSIELAVGARVEIIDPAKKTAEELLKSLESENKLREETEPTHKFFYSGSNEKFDKLMSLAFNKIFETKIIEL